MSTEVVHLSGVRCQKCGTAHIAPAWACQSCGGDEMGPEGPLSGLATIVTHTVVRRKSPGFPDVPYMIVVAQLAEGPQLLGWLQDFETAHAEVGSRIQFTHREERNIPQFKKVD